MSETNRGGLQQTGTTVFESDTTSDAGLVLPFTSIDRNSISTAGGKGANLGELARAGFPVPPGFRLSTRAYTLVASGAELEQLLAELERANPLDLADLARLAGEIRAAILNAPVPPVVRDALFEAYAALSSSGEPAAVAARSSATAEDLPDASFAGQQETYLNVVGQDALLDAVRHCWASLWTDRAVSYRAANGVDHRSTALAVVVQQMVPAQVSGVLFTANPLTNRRGEAVIDATPGLGEALVGGLVNPSHFVIDMRTSRILERRLVTPHLVVRAREGGGTEEVALGDAAETQPYLSDAQVLEIARLGERVEEHYGAPQDIEWALDASGRIWLLQARPITTLYPLPRPAADDDLQVYFSASVAQGVLQPITPMGVDMFRQVGAGLAAVAGVEIGPQGITEMLVAPAGRLFIHITPLLRSPIGRRLVAAVLTNMEPRTGDIVRGMLDDPRLAPHPVHPDREVARRILHVLERTRAPLRALRAFVAPARTRRSVLREVRAFLSEGEKTPEAPTAALDQATWIARNVGLRVMVPMLATALAVGVGSFQLIRRLAGAEGATDALLITRGVPHNPTTIMNLRLWDLSRCLRADPTMAQLLAAAPPADLAAHYKAGTLPPLLQGQVATFLRAYGFRGVAEIDTGLPRWSEQPEYIFSVLAGYIRMEEGEQAPDAQFRRARGEARAAMARLLARARGEGPRGLPRLLLLRFLFRRVRELLGLREAPKFFAVKAFTRCRELLQQVGVALVEAGRLERRDDIFFLTFTEARAALQGRDSRDLVAQRRAEYDREMKRRRVPRVLLSDGTTLYGESLSSAAQEPGALVGTPASPGVYSGVVRVVLDPANAKLNSGEVLVAPSTDPGWTPLFLSAGALVMEMGGMISHGAVVAREYGIPAVVGLLGATGILHTGQRVTVDGSRGLVLPAGDAPAA